MKSVRPSSSMRTILQLLHKTSHPYRFWMYTLGNAIVMILPSLILPSLEENLYLYVFLRCLVPLTNYIMDEYSDKVSNEVLSVFYEEAYETYASMTFTSKGEEPSEAFRRKLDEACQSMRFIIMWGFPTAIELVGSVGSTLYVFLYYDEVWLFVFYVLINGLLFLGKTRKIRDKYRDEYTRYIKCREMKVSLIEHKLPWMETGMISPNVLIDYENNIWEERMKGSHLWNRFTALTNVTNVAVMAMLPLLSLDRARVFMMVMITGNFTESLKNTLSFINEYGTFQVGIDAYFKLWDGKKFGTEVPSFPLPSELCIFDTDIHLENPQGHTSFRIRGGPFTIRQGERFLIQGPSGSGKTTFLEALMGKIPGICLISQHHKPENYAKMIMEVLQNAKEKMPTKAITIRQLFDDEPLDSIIQWYLEMMELGGWVSQIGSFDETINERHSGGEKTRLCIAVQLYRAVTHDVQMLILDEPEQGLEPSMAYRILASIFTSFPSLTILVVSHLETIRGRFSWDVLLSFKKGVYECHYPIGKPEEE